MYHESSNKISSGDNQQETVTRDEKLGYYLSGFTDGEGSFNVSIRRHKDYRIRWKVSLAFNVSQIGDSIPRLFRETFRCGTIRCREDKVCYFEVVKLQDILERVVPFFERYALLSAKQKDFLIFRKIARLMEKKKHLQRKGLGRIIELRNPMNRGGKNRRTKPNIILSSLK